MENPWRTTESPKTTQENLRKASKNVLKTEGNLRTNVQNFRKPLKIDGRLRAHYGKPTANSGALFF